MDTTSCPECGAPAEVTDRGVLESTAGPVEHVRVHCIRRHWFDLPAETLARHVGPRPTTPAPRPTAPQRSGGPPPPVR